MDSNDRKLLHLIYKDENSYYAFDGRTYSISKINATHARVLRHWDEDKEQLSRNLNQEQIFKKILAAHDNIIRFIYNGVFSYNDDPYINAPMFNKIILTLTENCNLACKYCFEESKASCKCSPAMSKKIARTSLLYLFCKSRCSEVTVQFYGGEPLLNYDVLQYSVIEGERLAKIYNKKVNYYLITNGTLINPEYARFLAKHNITVQVSIDGNCGAHNSNRTFRNGNGSYEQTRNGLTLLKQHHVNCNVMTVMSRAVLTTDNWLTNLDSMSSGAFGLCSVATHKRHLRPTKKQMRKFISDYRNYLKRKTQNYKRIDSNLHSVVKFVDHISNGKRFYYGCGCGLSEIMIGANGDIYLCERMVGKTGKSIEDNPELLDIWQPYVSNIFRKPCSACWAKYLCGGGCSHIALTISGKKRPYLWDCEKCKLEIETAIKCIVQQEELKAA